MGRQDFALDMDGPTRGTTGARTEREGSFWNRLPRNRSSSEMKTLRPLTKMVWPVTLNPYQIEFWLVVLTATRKKTDSTGRGSWERPWIWGTGSPATDRCSAVGHTCPLSAHGRYFLILKE